MNTLPPCPLCTSYDTIPYTYRPPAPRRPWSDKEKETKPQERRMWPGWTNPQAECACRLCDRTAPPSTGTFCRNCRFLQERTPPKD